jgi:hypothetical protein
MLPANAIPSRASVFPGPTRSSAEAGGMETVATENERIAKETKVFSRRIADASNLDLPQYIRPKPEHARKLFDF